jgi:hypothetical protein
MQLRLGSNTKQEIDDSKGLFVYFNVPHDTPEIRANIRGLILCLARPRFYQKDRREGVRNVYTARALDGIEVHFMSDELLNRGVNSLIEIEFVLKHLLTKFTDETDIKFFIDKPGEPAKLEDGTWDLADNKTLQSPGMSVFTVGSLLENNSITDVLKIAVLDDGTVQFPDINPFNLESKLDQIRSDITEAKDIHSWFGSAFYSGKWSDLNPWSIETFFQRFSVTFNDTYPITQIIRESFYGLHKKLNDNVVTSFNETNTDGVASNSYFRYLHTWLNSDWKLFQTVAEEIRDCICEAKGFAEAISLGINGIKQTIYDAMMTFEGQPILGAVNETLGGIKGAIEAKDTTVNVTVDPTPITINPCCDDLTQATKDIADGIKDLVDATKDTGSTTTDNGDGTYTTKPNLPDYPPIDETEPNGETTKPYKTTQINRSNSHDAKCGFLFWYLNQLADAIDIFATWTANLIELAAFFGITVTDIISKFTTIVSLLGLGASGGTALPVVAGVNLLKAGGVTAVKVGLGYITYQGTEFVEDKWHDVADLIRTYSNEAACSPVLNNVSKQALLTAVTTATNPIIGGGVLACWLMSLIYDYANGTDSSNVIVNMDDYAQYCPCPTPDGIFSGHWWNGVSGTNERHFYLSHAGDSVIGTHTSKDLFGTVYQFDVTCTIDPTNELSALGTKVCTGPSQIGQVTANNMLLSANFLELYYGNGTYTKI